VLSLRRSVHETNAQRPDRGRRTRNEAGVHAVVSIDSIEPDAAVEILRLDRRIGAA
jgi:hypothetical protein